MKPMNGRGCEEGAGWPPDKLSAAGRRDWPVHWDTLLPTDMSLM